MDDLVEHTRIANFYARVNGMVALSLLIVFACLVFLSAVYSIYWKVFLWLLGSLLMISQIDRQLPRVTTPFIKYYLKRTSKT